jgi:protein-tyrosine phosphatase
MSFDRTLDESALFRMCFVCTGNICRSPMAEAVFKDLVRGAGLEGVVAVISAGTGDWHVGEPSDDRTVAALRARGLDGTHHRAKQFDPLSVLTEATNGFFVPGRATTSIARRCNCS